MEIEFEKNKKYFMKKNWILAYIALGVIVVGIVFVALLGFRKGLWAIFLTIAGIVALIASLTGGMKDADIDASVTTVTNRLPEHAHENFKFPRRYEVLHPAVTMGGYDFTRKEEFVAKRGKDLKYRCGYYCALLMNFTNDGLRIDSQKFSILEDDNKIDLLHFAWEDIEGSALEEEPVTVHLVDGSEATLNVNIYRLKLKDGSEYTWCVRNDSDVDEAIDVIYRQTVRTKQEALKTLIEEEQQQKQE